MVMVTQGKKESLFCVEDYRHMHHLVGGSAYLRPFNIYSVSLQ